MNLEQEVADLKNRLNNIVRPGVVDDADYDKGLVRVKSGKLRTTWLPFMAARSNSWDPLRKGEQCIIVSPAGDLTCGFVVASIYSDQFKPPSTDPSRHVKAYEDGTIVSYDEKSHTLSIQGGDKLKIEIKNSKGNLIETLSKALQVISTSKTPTMLGPRAAIEDQAQLPELSKVIDSFIPGDSHAT